MNNWESAGVVLVILIQIGTLVWVVSNHGSRITTLEQRADGHDEDHDAHYKHEAMAEIHQRSLSEQTLDAKFRDLANQLIAISKENESRTSALHRQNQDRMDALSATLKDLAEYQKVTSKRWHDTIAPMLTILNLKFPEMFNK